jgi:para-aminobenzoate synthetase/4-amino-4-deoxychorismate lyase
MPPRARLDDLTLGDARSFEFVDPRGVVAADSHREVEAAFSEVSRAVDDGLWAAGYVAYEAAPAFDSAFRVVEPSDEHGFVELPVLWFGLFGERVAAEPFGPRSIYPAPYNVSGWTPEVTPDEYAAAVEAIHAHIAAGDTYQVNLTFPLGAAVSGEVAELYRDLVLAQRGAYGVHLDTGRFQVLSASPERFFRLAEGRIDLRPMKGTIRRGRWPAEDAALASRLRDSEKDRAENLMIVDLLRNDLGRIATFGSVNVESLLVAERYETVWQLTSDIAGRVDPSVRLYDVFSALFPSGSVTGAPKVRTMEIIADLEASPRGVYCGAVGYIEPTADGQTRAEFNVAIRTVTIDAEEGLARYGVGGAVTWDSSPEGEYEEARLKAQLLIERRPRFDLVETMRWDPDRGYWWYEEHLERLAQSAEYFGYSCDLAVVDAGLDAAVSGAGSVMRVRLTLDRHGEVAVEATEISFPFAADFEDGPEVRVAIAVEPISSQNVFLFHKTTNRDPYTRRMKRYPSAEDVILVNELGRVTESMIANVALRRDGAWVTPPVADGLLGGVYRGHLLAEGLIEEGTVGREELVASEEVALFNSVRGWFRARFLS